MTWWNDFWNWAETSQLGSNVVGGLIVALVAALAALVASIVKTSWRHKIWGSVARLLDWIRTLRITTTERVEKEYERGIDDGWAARDQEVNRDAQPKKGIAINFAATPGGQPRKALAGPPTPPIKPLPSPTPRWRIYESEPEGDGLDFVVENSVERSVALEVRLEASASYFEFYDGAHWAEASGVCTRAFRGKISSWARDRGGVDFDITWIDENGESHSRTYKLKAYQPRGPEEEDLHPF